MKRRMKPNPDKRETGYHSHEHDEDPTCHKTHEGDTPCEPVEEERFFCSSCQKFWTKDELVECVPCDPPDGCPDCHGCCLELWPANAQHHTEAGRPTA